MTTTATLPDAPMTLDAAQSSDSGVSGTVTSIWNGIDITFVTISGHDNWFTLDSGIVDGPEMLKTALVDGKTIYAALNEGTTTIYGFAIYA